MPKSTRNCSRLREGQEFFGRDGREQRKERMAAVGSFRSKQGGTRPQALGQSACAGGKNGPEDGPRCVHAAYGGHKYLGRAIRPDFWVRSRGERRAVRSLGKQGGWASDCFRISRD